MKSLNKTTLALFACAFLITLLVTAPASLLDTLLQYATQGRVVLANGSGTIWSGSATPALRQEEGRFIALQPLHWEVAALPLFTGKIQARLQWTDLPSAPAMNATLSLNQIELRHALIPLPARVLSEASPMLQPAAFRGQLQMQSEQLVFSKRGMEGAASIDWQQAGSALSSMTPLGNYHLALNGEGERINVTLATSSGKLQLNGQGAWTAAHGLEFHGKAQLSPEAQASPASAASLNELLQHLGPEESPGVHSFNLTPQ